MGENLDTLRRMIELLGAGEYDAATQLLAEDLVVDEPPGLPQGGVWRGQDSSAKLKQLITSTWSQQVTPAEYWESGDAVFMRREVVWTAKATGKTVESPVLEHYQFKGGKIARISIYIKDVPGLAATLVP